MKVLSIRRLSLPSSWLWRSSLAFSRRDLFFHDKTLCERHCADVNTSPWHANHLKQLLIRFSLRPLTLSNTSHCPLSCLFKQGDWNVHSSLVFSSLWLVVRLCSSTLRETLLIQICECFRMINRYIYFPLLSQTLWLLFAHRPCEISNSVRYNGSN